MQQTGNPWYTIQTAKKQKHIKNTGNDLKQKTLCDKLTSTKNKEENNMFAAFATKVAVKVVPKLIANPVLAVEMAPVIAIAGAAVAIYDLVNK